MLFTISKPTISDRFDEFDLWITPKLTEIKDTDKYASELEEIMTWLDNVAQSTSNFNPKITLTAEVLTDAILKKLSTLKKKEEVEAQLTAAASLLFLVTGKSDNNCKCQFPLFLRDKIRVDSIPSVKRKNGSTEVLPSPIPREIKSDRVASLVGDLIGFPKIQREFLLEYISFILDEDAFLNSFWAIGNSYVSMKEFGLHKEFLMPLVVFKIRGSVSASGGHDPENILRSLMKSWGLEEDSDFNKTDIIIGEEKKGGKVKTRAYDFVLPFNVKGWSQKIFIQCQFYAGDSGSVSHKNVDQTRASRDFTKKKIKSPIFIEFLDGAGYFSSLNGDLKSLLSMKDTTDFFQLRTAALKLRRALQAIKFLTPLELAHALILSALSKKQALKLLEKDGYSKSEFDRVFDKSLNLKLIKETSDSCEINPSFLEVVTSYLLYDQIINNSAPLKKQDVKGGVFLVPGSTAFQGVKFSQLTTIVTTKSGVLNSYFSKSANLMKELESLADSKYIISL